MAIDMLSKTNGKASAYQEHLNAIIKKTNNFVPTIEALSKISNEYKNYEMVSTCWITNIHYVSDSMYATIPAKRVKGYVQSCELDQNLLINLHSEQQLKALGKIPLAERIIHILMQLVV